MGRVQQPTRWGRAGGITASEEQMLSLKEIKQILRLVRDRASFVVVDCRAPAGPEIFEVFVRPWSADGVIVRPLLAPNLDALQAVLSARGDVGPVVMETANARLPADFADALRKLDGFVNL